MVGSDCLRQVRACLLVNVQEVQRIQQQRLVRLLREVGRENTFYRAVYRGVGLDPDHLAPDDRTPVSELLAPLPFTHKAAFQESQSRCAPYGDFLTYPRGAYTRIHQTSGSTGRPLRWLDTADSWNWILSCWDRIYDAAGVTADDRVFFPFSFGPFIGFWAAFEGAARRGCFVLPGGGMRSALRLRALVENEVSVVACTPTYALHLAEVADAEGVDLAASAVRLVIVAGEPGGSIPATRARLEAKWGARCIDHSGATEVGSVGFEHRERPGDLFVPETDFVVEVLRPDEDVPVSDGETGEMVITNLGRVGSPAIRYRTGDLVLWRPAEDGLVGSAPFGRLEGGVLSRLDDMVIIRGNNVYPAAIEGILRRFDNIAEFRIRVTREGALTELFVEIEPVAGSKQLATGSDRVAESDEQLVERVRHAMERELLFRAEVRVVPPGTLPRFELKGKRFVRDR